MGDWVTLYLTKKPKTMRNRALSDHRTLSGNYRKNFNPAGKAFEPLEFLRYTTEKKNAPKKDKAENMSKPKIMTLFVGCGVAVKALRLGFMDLLADYTDSRFMGRLMKLVAVIYQRDKQGVKGKHAIRFSENRPLLATIKLQVGENAVEQFANEFVYAINEARTATTLKMDALYIRSTISPHYATHFRIINRLSIISDFAFSESNQRYEPSGLLNGMTVSASTGYIPVGSYLAAEIVARFPAGTVLSDQDSVILCVGVEFSQKDGNRFLPLKGSSFMVVEVF